MIFTDGVHIISDTSIDDLHNWCADQGIGRHFFHTGGWPHYDIPKKRRNEQFPANYVTVRELIKILRSTG